MPTSSTIRVSIFHRLAVLWLCDIKQRHLLQETRDEEKRTLRCLRCGAYNNLYTNRLERFDRNGEKEVL
jgi:hypothetical protein